MKITINIQEKIQFLKKIHTIESIKKNVKFIMLSSFPACPLEWAEEIQEKEGKSLFVSKPMIVRDAKNYLTLVRRNDDANRNDSTRKNFTAYDVRTIDNPQEPEKNWVIAIDLNILALPLNENLRLQLNNFLNDVLNPTRHRCWKVEDDKAIFVPYISEKDFFNSQPHEINVEAELKCIAEKAGFSSDIIKTIDLKPEHGYGCSLPINRYCYHIYLDDNDPNIQHLITRAEQYDKAFINAVTADVLSPYHLPRELVTQIVFFLDKKTDGAALARTHKSAAESAAKVVRAEKEYKLKYQQAENTVTDNIHNAKRNNRHV